MGFTVFFTMLTASQVFAAAGEGGDITGGSCGNNYTTWDTCFGGSWRFYRLAEPVPVRQDGAKKEIFYDTGSDSIIIPGVGHVDGGTISGCKKDDSVGFFKFGLDVYKPGEGSLGYHAGMSKQSFADNIFNVGGANYSISSLPDPLTLASLDTFIRSVPANATFDDNAMETMFNFIYDEIQKGRLPADRLSGLTWSGNLAWFCSGVFQSEGGEVHTNSNVHAGDNGSDYRTTDWAKDATANMPAAAGPGDTVYVRFSHNVRYTASVENNVTIQRSIQLEQTKSGTVTPTITPTATPASPYPFSVTSAYVPNTPVNAYPSHTYQLTFPATLTTSGTYTMCEKVTVQENYKYEGKDAAGNPKWTGGTWSSRACAVITFAPNPPDITANSCPLPNSTYTINKGGSQAQTEVTNRTSAKNVKTSGTNSTPVFVWAKPGDSVQFKHTLCYGAQSVRGSTATTQENRTIVPSSSNTATITAKRTDGSAAALGATGGKNGNYLFGNTLTGTNTQAFTLTAGESKPTQIANVADDVGDYWFSFYSPSIGRGNSGRANAAGNKYKCNSAAHGLATFLNNSYQIPGFSATSSNRPADCPNPVSTSDVGTVIEQAMDWANVKAWVNQASDQGSGSCSCGDDSATANQTSMTYDSSLSSGYSYGYHQRDCIDPECCGGEYCPSYSYTLEDYWYYPISTTSTAGAKQIAQVKIPYNYNLVPTVTLPSLPVVYEGSDVSAAVSVATTGRANAEVSSSNYATVSKSSVYEIVVFTVAPATASGSIAHANSNYSGGSGVQACSYYNRGAQSCLSLSRVTGKRFNDGGSLYGASESIFSDSISVPDAEVGTKICVAAGVWPSDSHDLPGGVANAAGTGDIALKDTGNRWNYSEPVCRTIAKKPTVNFESSGVYTNGGIITSQTKKSVGYTFGLNGSGNGLLSTSEKGDRRRVFGSWSEYETIAKGSIATTGGAGFASGAAFGYDRNNGGNKPAISRNSNPANYFEVNRTADPNVCTYSTQTFSNNRCSSKTVGLSSINSMGTTVLERILSRYSNLAASAVPSARCVVVDEGDGACHDAAYGGNSPSQKNVQTFSTSGGGVNTNTKYVRVANKGSGVAYLPAGLNFCVNRNDEFSRIVIIEAEGTLRIDENIYYGQNYNQVYSGPNQNAISGANLPLVSGGSNCVQSMYSSLAQLPQTIIMADEILISKDVTQIDAWLIAGKGEGVINTCTDYIFANLSSNVCNKTLTVNGPVFAGKLILNRTAGAGVGPSSIQPAEIFNLRSDAFLWGFAQAQRFNQAVTTYSRELAPRY
jgi:hypothetical protein